MAEPPLTKNNGGHLHEPADITTNARIGQVRGYVRLEPVREIQDFFLAQMANPMDEEDCYSLSLVCQVTPGSRGGSGGGLAG